MLGVAATTRGDEQDDRPSLTVLLHGCCTGLSSVEDSVSVDVCQEQKSRFKTGRVSTQDADRSRDGDAD